MFLVVRLWDAGDLFPTGPTGSIYRPTTDFRLNSMCFHLALGDDSCRLPLRSNLQLGVHYIIPKDVGAGVYFSLEALPWRRCLISSNLLICKMAGLEEVGSSGSSFVGSLVGGGRQGDASGVSFLRLRRDAQREELEMTPASSPVPLMQLEIVG